MDLNRVIRHMLAPSWIVRRAFPRAALARIEGAIKASESLHDGEVRFAVEAGFDLQPLLRGMTPRERALDLFSRLRIWDTDHNSGVLIYVQLVDHRIEIIADRGINARVAQEQWDAICRRMEAAFRARRFEDGVLRGIEEVTALLARHFPPLGANPNELPDSPVVL
jgi:uncharacterized membrane protein